MDKITPFQLWLHNIWLDNCAEHEGWNELPLTKQEYWRRYKYWLRREYRWQQGQLARPPVAIRSAPFPCYASGKR